MPMVILKYSLLDKTKHKKLVIQTVSKTIKPKSCI